MKKEIVSKSFGLIIKEAFMFLVIRIVLLAQSFFETVANQAASNIEIERMKGEVSYAFANFVINHQDSFTAIFTFISFLLWLLAIFILFRDGNKIINLIKNEKEKK
ncbi:MAG: hypothetical protein PT936_02455 [Treponema sp.]|nr:hypothetical protein [Treponema sp.]